MRLAGLVICLAFGALGGCESCGTDGVHHQPDAPPLPPSDGPAVTGGAMVVTQSPPGPQNGDPASWEGLLAYKIATDGATEVPITGLDKTSVHDPVSVLYRAASSEILVSDRHGNNSADGIAGSVSRFRYDPATQALTPNGQITGNGLSGVHQCALSPATGELFCANVNTGVSRFTFRDDGSAVAHGTISEGPTRGVAVAPDGARLYVTTASNVIRQYELAGGTELAPTSITSIGGLHFLAIRDHDLYVAALEDGEVYRYAIGADDSLTFRQEIVAPSPSAVAISESGNEMFTTGHRTSSVIARFRYDWPTDTWLPTVEINAQVSLGGIALLPIR